MKNNKTEIEIINNKCLQQNDFIEWVNALIGKRIKIPFIIVAVTYILFYTIVLISVILKKDIVSNFYIALVTVCLIIALLFRFVLAKLIGKLRYKQYCITHNEGMGAVVFYNRCLELKIGNEIITKFSYRCIKNTILTKNLYIIVFPNMVNCIVRIDGFNKKDFEIIQVLINQALSKERKL